MASGWELRPWLRWVLALGLCFVNLWRPGLVLAHVGAPYPVLLEEPVGPYIASAMADPDVGKGTFYVLLTLPDGNPVPADTEVTIWVVPKDGHVAEAGHVAGREETRYGERFVVEVPFDAKGDWQARLEVDGPAGSGEIAFPVKVTPSGIGWLGTVACLVPFVLLGLLWLRGAKRQREHR